MPNRRGDGGWNSRGGGGEGWKNCQNLISDGWEGGGERRNYHKFKRFLLIFKQDFLDFHLCKMSIYLET